MTVLSAGIVILHQDPPACRYLLLRCYRYWDFPKGRIEPDETAFSAACREVREETTLNALAFSWGQVFIETAPYGDGKGNDKIARYYLATTRDMHVQLLPSPQLGHAEHQEFRWLAYAAARALLGARLQPVLDWAHHLSGC